MEELCCLWGLSSTQDRVLLNSPGYPGTHHVDQVGLEFTEISLPPHRWLWSRDFFKCACDRNQDPRVCITSTFELMKSSVIIIVIYTEAHILIYMTY